MKVLIIEDEDKIATALKRGLEREGYAVDLTANSDEGLEAAMSGDYNLIILDRMLPGQMEGVELCQYLRAQKVHTPIIMLTAKDSVDDKIAGLNSGADDYLVKPFAYEELVARMRALLRRPEEALSTVLTVGDLTLNTTTYEVRRSGKLISLSNKEYTLLNYLMRHENQVLSKNNIIGHVWNFDADILDNTVEVYIGYLRTKLEKSFRGPTLIHTIRGFGYRFGVE
jgi:DNA-binding response OmpR family regulator